MKKKRERTLRREIVRENDKLVEARAKLASLEIGGSPARPEPLDSASQIEGRARSLLCFRCDSPLGISEHRALHDPHAGPVRELDLVCPRCGTKRRAYYQVKALN